MGEKDYKDTLKIIEKNNSCKCLTTFGATTAHTFPIISKLKATVFLLANPTIQLKLETTQSQNKLF